MTNRKLVTIEMFSGSSGDSLYINEYRIAGSKPWGGSRSVTTWKVDREKLIHYLIQADVLDGEPVKERSSEPDGNLEPVAWMYRYDGQRGCSIGRKPPGIESEYGIQDLVPLYTAPPKRVWQGLTDGERVQAFVDAGLELAYMDYDADKRISEVIEAKLREKNT